MVKVNGFCTSWMGFFLFFRILAIVLPVLISVAYFTIAERKIMAAVQRRRGPNVVGFVGILQPLADGLKLFIKETTIPANSFTSTFVLAPALSFVFSIISWAVIPIDEGIVFADLNLGLLYLFAVSSLGVYGVLLAGWSSNSKYAFLGCIRSAAQMISYEISMGVTALSVVICSGSFNLSNIVLTQNKTWFIYALFPMFLIFSVTMLAETNRHPFDLPEAESELVSGYNVEYSAMLFALFFLSEYSNMLLMSSFASILFLGGWLAPLPLLNFFFDGFWMSLKIILGVAFFIGSRAMLPRYRFDQLLKLGWRYFLLVSFSYFVCTASCLLGFNVLPG